VAQEPGGLIFLLCFPTVLLWANHDCFPSAVYSASHRITPNSGPVVIPWPRLCELNKTREQQDHWPWNCHTEQYNFTCAGPMCSLRVPDRLPKKFTVSPMELAILNCLGSKISVALWLCERLVSLQSSFDLATQNWKKIQWNKTRQIRAIMP